MNMINEKLKILEMLQDGTINAEEAFRLMESLGGEPTAVREVAAKPAQAAERAAKTGSTSGKKLRVEVRGFDEGEKVNVNVAVPMVLARFADNIISNCIPDGVNDSLEGKGINLKKLNLGELIDSIETLDEDLVNLDVTEKDTDLKVRVYVE